MVAPATADKVLLQLFKLNGIGSFIGACDEKVLLCCLKPVVLLFRGTKLVGRAKGGGGATGVDIDTVAVTLDEATAALFVAAVTKDTVVSLVLLIGNSKVWLVLRGVAGVTVMVAMLVMGFLVLIKGLFLRG